MGRNPSSFKSCGKDAPVENLSWDDCQKFLKKLNKLCEDWLQTAWSHMRLPSEAEWEYACRAGSATRFNLGDTDADLARAGWFAGNSVETTHPVGKKSPNAWGLYDMHGNVWECCEDNWKDDYCSAPTDGSAMIGGSSSRVIRGGCWGHYARCCRSAYRGGVDPGNRYRNLGFRPVMPMAVQDSISRLSLRLEQEQKI